MLRFLPAGSTSRACVEFLFADEVGMLESAQLYLRIRRANSHLYLCMYLYLYLYLYLYATWQRFLPAGRHQRWVFICWWSGEVGASTALSEKFGEAALIGRQRHRRSCVASSHVADFIIWSSKKWQLWREKSRRWRRRWWKEVSGKNVTMETFAGKKRGQIDS